MKKITPITFLLLFSYLCYGQTMNIRINQVGYYPGATKKAIIVWPQNATTFEVKKVSDNSTVFTGTLSEMLYSQSAGDSVKIADFSTLNEPGNYFISIPGGGTSLSFIISKTVLRPVAYGSLKSFYYQRNSYELKSEYAGLWARAAGHPDNNCIFHSSSGKTGKAASPWGWYDAGDYGKYVVNAGITVGTLLQTYECFPGYFSDSTILIPESGNKKNDLLDEVKFELDWVKTMQDVDGGVFHKVTTLSFPGFIMPQNDNSDRYIIGKPTSTTLDFAAIMSMAGRVYKNYDSAFASECIKAAEKAWEWAIANPAVYFSNPTDVTTGAYGDTNVSDEFIWAASELLITTGKTEYKNYLENKINQLKYQIPSWRNVNGMASLSLATRSNTLHDTINTTIKNSLIAAADKLISDINKSAYRISNNGFGWGYTSVYSNAGICLVYAYLLTKDQKYILAAGELADYLLGKNATGFSFFTYYGHKTPMNIHHRPSGADNIIQPVPGFISGGPSGSNRDGCYYAYSSPAKFYTDHQDSYASNEVCINWNAPATFLLAAIDKVLGDSAEPVEFKVINKVNNPPSAALSLGNYAVFNENADINIEVSVTSKNVKKAELYIDSKYIGEITKTPFKWTINYLPVDTHTVSVSVIDSNELVTERPVSIRVVEYNDVTSINNENKTNLIVASNPATSNSVVNFCTYTNGLVCLDVLDFSGKIIASKTCKSEAGIINKISWSSFNINESGTFILTLKQNGKIIASTKVINVKK